MKSFPRLVRSVLSDMLSLYSELGQGPVSKATTALRTRLLKLVEASGVEISHASHTANNTGGAKKKKGAEQEEESVHEFAEELERLCLKDGDVEQSKRAIRVLSSMARSEVSNKTEKSSPKKRGADSEEASSVETISRIMTSLASSKHLKVDNKRLLAVLHVLREVAKNFPDIFKPHAQKVIFCCI
jgi:hypothetical protein